MPSIVTKFNSIPDFFDIDRYQNFAQYSHCKQGRLQDLLNINSFKLILSKFKIVLNAYVYKISLITDVELV